MHLQDRTDLESYTVRLDERPAAPFGVPLGGSVLTREKEGPALARAPLQPIFITNVTNGTNFSAPYPLSSYCGAPCAWQDGVAFWGLVGGEAIESYTAGRGSGPGAPALTAPLASPPHRPPSASP